MSNSYLISVPVRGVSSLRYTCCYVSLLPAQCGMAFLSDFFIINEKEGERLHKVLTADYSEHINNDYSDKWKLYLNRRKLLLTTVVGSELDDFCIHNKWTRIGEVVRNPNSNNEICTYEWNRSYDETSNVYYEEED